MLSIYVDGSCKANGKSVNEGGFGVVVTEYWDTEDHAVIRECYAKRSQNTTNNKEELRAILWAMCKYGRHHPKAIVYSDSSYCVNTFNDWMFRWKANGWLKSDGQKPENLDLIMGYWYLWNEGLRIDLRKIKGHAGHEYNELADKLATGAISVEEAMNLG